MSWLHVATCSGAEAYLWSPQGSIFLVDLVPTPSPRPQSTPRVLTGHILPTTAHRPHSRTRYPEFHTFLQVLACVQHPAPHPNWTDANCATAKLWDSTGTCPRRNYLEVSSGPPRLNIFVKKFNWGDLPTTPFYTQTSYVLLYALLQRTWFKLGPRASALA